MQIFITGGCKNGKSTHAQQLAAAQQPAGRPLYYLATMQPGDSEDRERVARHQQERAGMGFVTVEQPRGIDQVLSRCDPQGSFLLDSLTALLANEMFTGPQPDAQAVPRTMGQLEALLEACPHIVVVSDYIYSEPEAQEEGTADYCRGLAALDRLCASRCQVVLELCFGNVVVHKGMELWNEKLF